MDTVYVLLDEKEKSWGIYSNKHSLYNMCYNLKLMNTNMKYKLHEYSINSNIIKNIIQEEDISSHLGFTQRTSSNVSNQTAIIPKEIRREVEKIKEKLSIFKENFVTFHRLLKDKKIQLDETNLGNIPPLFKDKFVIFRDIILKKVPEEDMFSYFADRYVPSQGSLTIETINDMSDIDASVLNFKKNVESEEETEEESEEESEEDSEEESTEESDKENEHE